MLRLLLRSILGLDQMKREIETSRQHIAFLEQRIALLIEIVGRANDAGLVLVRAMTERKEWLTKDKETN